MSNLISKLKDVLLNTYLSPINNNTRLALSIRNRIMQEMLHLNGSIFAIKRLINKQDLNNSIIVDVGCFDGNTSIFFSKEFRNVKVIGFEAGKQSYEKALKNASAYSLIKIENYAASDHDGVAEFFVTDNKVSSSLNSLSGSDKRFDTEVIEQVNTISLDSYFKNESLENKNILLIKLDVQGHEVSVLKGAQSVLQNTSFVLTEMSNHKSYSGGAQYYEVDRVLRESGFTLHNIFAPYSYGPSLYEFDALYINSKLIK